MATALSAAHQAWRKRIFITTWLGYVGFYFCRRPFSAAKADMEVDAGWTPGIIVGDIWAFYLIAYAIGQFLASYMGQRIGPRRNVLIGMVLSIAAAVGMGSSLDVAVLKVLATILGLAQATGWSGSVGTMASWFHKHERGKVMGAWSTNFTVGSLSSTYTMGGVLALAAGIEGGWRWCFYTGAIVLAVVCVQFYLLQRNRPEDVGLAPIDDPVTAVDEAKEPDPPGLGLSRTAWTNLLLVGGFYFFSKFVRYAVWSWSAYLLKKSYGLSSSQANVYATAFDLAGIFGVLATGYLSDKYFASRRAGVSLIMMFGMMVSTALLMMFAESNVVVFVILLAAVGFTLYGPDALLTGAGAIDIGGRKAATFATAMISGFGSMGPVVQEVIIPRVYDAKAAEKSGDLGVVFLLLFLSATMATVFCGILVWRNRRGGKGI
ncbi:MAG TPA: MFS transporter [Kofleriaceae bacterium]